MCRRVAFILSDSPCEEIEMDRVRYLRLTVAAAVAVALAAAVGMSLVRSSGEKAGVRSGTGSSPRAIPVAEPATIMWPSWLCGLQPIDAQDLALSRSGTPHNHLLTDSKRLGVAGARGVATTNIDAGVDRQIPAKSWANPRSRWLSQRPFRERRTRACYASIGPWNPMLMWRSAGVPFQRNGRLLRPAPHN